jgi:CDP-diacylglycerol--serine O-phosphatidyltransferase
VKCFTGGLGVSLATGKYGESNAIDLSDWGRPFARVIAKYLQKKPVSVIQVTNLHLVLSIFCAWLILDGHTVVSCFLLIVKGVIDAVDGELARIRERPSHVGRYWDTVADTIGLIAVMYAFGTLLEWEIGLTFTMILAILFQYSLFNHFSIMMRLLGSGDSTSRIDERIRPIAQPWERQRNVNTLHLIYILFFSWQDSIISKLTGKGSDKLVFELTVSSILGYGTQSIFIFLLAVTNNIDYLPHLFLGVNMILMLLVILRSRF